MVRLLTPVFRARHGADPDAMDDAVCNAIELAYENVINQAKQGKIADDSMLIAFVRQSLWFAVRGTHAGRTVARKPNTAPKKFGDMMDRLDRREPEEAMDSLISGELPAEEATLRIDLEAFCRSLSVRQKLMLFDMVCGYSTDELARLYAVSPGAISQWRRKFVLLYKDFTDF
jgi:hypothetical protein